MTKKTESSSTKLAAVEDRSLVDFVTGAMTTYGTEVNLERAIPDFRDGLKPVARRSLWALSLIGLDARIKAARIVGDTLGKFHPHGDSSCYGAVVTVANMPVPPIEGEGNWGTLTDPPAAMRYTNARMSMYGKMFFGKNYRPVMDLVPNFDRTHKEPLVLPSLLPNLLFNGSSGIGVGVVTSIPAFTPGSVIKMMVRILNKEDLKPIDYAKGMEFYYQYGGRLLKTKDNLKRVVALFSGTKGSVIWESPLEIDETKKQIRLFKFAPGIDPIKLLEGKTDKAGKKIKLGVKDWDDVARAYSAGKSYVVQARKDLNMNEFKVLVERLRKLTVTSQSYEIYVTERVLDPEAGDDKYKVNFFTCSLPDLMKKWLKWRIQLEIRSLDWQIGKTQQAIDFLKLLIYAADKLDIIFKALRSDDASGYLIKHMKINEAQAKQILDLQVRKLSKLDQSVLKTDLKGTQTQLEELQAKRAKPVAQVRKFLEACADRFDQYQVHAGTDQWKLVGPKKEKSE